MSYEFPPKLTQNLWDHLSHQASMEAVLFERLCQSPIEITFGLAFSFVVRLYYSSPLFLLDPVGHVRYPDAQFNGPIEFARFPSHFYIRPQHQIGKHRVDFLCGKSEISAEAIVELDGRDFHHATREQIERDRVRDKELKALGYRVFRFPGTQIHNDPINCAGDVIFWLTEEAS